ncbi:hypothetical protein V6N13_063990 [Hibiscus sabdariffa]|uniref:Uncharacterized protein n=2 Tax=Hibiscus sabdariffa TaxID=183260 RepID=A0ABR2BBT5_9ROSI
MCSIIISGRPGVIQPYLASMEALVAAWLPGSEGQGVGITGKISFTCSRLLISCQCMLEIHIMIPLPIKALADRQTKKNILASIGYYRGNQGC